MPPYPALLPFPLVPTGAAKGSGGSGGDGWGESELARRLRWRARLAAAGFRVQEDDDPPALAHAPGSAANLMPWLPCGGVPPKGGP